jgi:hypothetical protein
MLEFHTTKFGGNRDSTDSDNAQLLTSHIVVIVSAVSNHKCFPCHSNINAFQITYLS